MTSPPPRGVPILSWIINLSNPHVVAGHLMVLQRFPGVTAASCLHPVGVTEFKGRNIRYCDMRASLD